MLKITVGVDESGRGPVLGPLVMVAIAANDEQIQKLEWMGVKDSKLLSKQVREELFEQIRDAITDFRVQLIEPDAIDLSMQESNLNWLEADTTALMASELKPDKLIVDCPSVNQEAYKRYLLDQLPPDVKENLELIVEHKADFNYIVVAAASVVAKVIRDRWIEHQKQQIDIDFGSGYMSDPKTQDFLRRYHDTFPDLFRKRWKSYSKALEEKKQTNLADF